MGLSIEKQKMFVLCWVKVWTEQGQEPLHRVAWITARQSGESTSGVTSDSSPIWNRLLTGGELSDYAETFGIRQWIYLHSCLPT